MSFRDPQHRALELGVQRLPVTHTVCHRFLDLDFEKGFRHSVHLVKLPVTVSASRC